MDIIFFMHHVRNKVHPSISGFFFLHGSRKLPFRAGKWVSHMVCLLTIYTTITYLPTCMDMDTDTDMGMDRVGVKKQSKAKQSI